MLAMKRWTSGVDFLSETEIPEIYIDHRGIIVLATNKGSLVSLVMSYGYLATRYVQFLLLITPFSTDDCI